MILLRRLLEILLVWALPCFVLAAAIAWAQDTAPPNRSLGKHLSAKGIPNFGEVTPQLYRGGQPSPEGFEKLARMGVGIVVDFGRSPRDERQIHKLGMQYVSIPWHCPFPEDKYFAQFLKVVETNPGKKIFAHCRLGNDRTGMMIASYRMGAQGWSADQAMKEMQQFGFSTAHHFICPGLAGYEKSFPERFKKNKAFEELRSFRGTSRGSNLLKDHGQL